MTEAMGGNWSLSVAASTVRLTADIGLMLIVPSCWIAANGRSETLRSLTAAGWVRNRPVRDEVLRTGTRRMRWDLQLHLHHVATVVAVDNPRIIFKR